MKLTKEEQYGIDLADAQLTGFTACYTGGPSPIRELVGSMGLTEKEWEYMKKNNNISGWVPQSIIDEIEEYFEEGAK